MIYFKNRPFEFQYDNEIIKGFLNGEYDNEGLTLEGGNYTFTSDNPTVIKYTGTGILHSTFSFTGRIEGSKELERFIEAFDEAFDEIDFENDNLIEI